MLGGVGIFCGMQVQQRWILDLPQMARDVFGLEPDARQLGDSTSRNLEATWQEKCCKRIVAKEFLMA